MVARTNNCDVIYGGRAALVNDKLSSVSRGDVYASIDAAIFVDWCTDFVKFERNSESCVEHQ